uniref:Uncharacterized protein n=1 Tax=Arundo donax TaxID=35708 RepID=A0A0A8XRS3_ARUDO
MCKHQSLSGQPWAILPMDPTRRPGAPSSVERPAILREVSL